MKIAMLVRSFPVITETFIINQITGMIDKGHDVEILAFHKGKTNVIHDSIKKYRLLEKTTYIGGNMPVSKIKRSKKALRLLIKNTNKTNFKDILKTLNIFKYGKGIMSLRSLFALLNITSKKEYDIIHCQFGPFGVDALLLKEMNLLDGKIITSFRGDDITQGLNMNKKGYEKLFAEGDLFLPVCEYFKKILIENNCPEERICVHYSSIDVNHFKKSNPQKNEDKKYLDVISIARLEEKKGLSYSIKAVSDHINNGYNIYYTIIGEGSLRKQLSYEIEAYGTQNSIRLIGNKNHNEILGYLNNADLFIAPSVTAKNGDKEGIPNAIKEAMIMKIPVISTFHSGIPELVDDNITGYLVPERNSNEIYEKILYILNNPSLQKEIKENALRKIKENFSHRILNNELEDIYYKLLYNI